MYSLHCFVYVTFSCTQSGFLFPVNIFIPRNSFEFEGTHMAIVFVKALSLMQIFAPVHLLTGRLVIYNQLE